MKTSRAKLILSGNTLEIYLYSTPVQYDFGNEPKPKLYTGNKDEKYKQLNKEGSVRRTRRNIRQLVRANGWQWKKDNGNPYTPVFITFTFAENITDLTEAHQFFKRFIHRFNYHVFGRGKTQLKYICVPEFQKRGAVHYHVIFFNLPFIENIYDTVKAVWSYGHHITETIKTPEILAQYICKYITKELLDSRLKGRKRILCSQGLLKPLTLRSEQNIADILQELPPTALAYGDKHKEGTPQEVQYLRYDLSTNTGINIKQLDSIKQLLVKYEQYNYIVNP
jgi:hypothetical protein